MSSAAHVPRARARESGGRAEGAWLRRRASLCTYERTRLAPHVRRVGRRKRTRLRSALHRRRCLQRRARPRRWHRAGRRRSGL